ncbi:MAG: threonine synthase [Muribaculaceae bacterium]|jgi:threonine synthase|nr:threonine synthase [Muribaculaceae bacterium]
MEYYSTNGKTANVTLKEAVVKGLAADRGLFMPKTIPTLPDVFFKNIGNLSLQEISYAVAYTLFGEDIETEQLKDIVYDTLNFDIPLVHVADDRYSLELFHGPTLAFKDVGARFMARLLGYFNKQEKGLVNVLVATSGDTGSAVANGFLGVEGVRVFVLYPQGKVSKIQESQFTTLGKNITAIEVNGTFDDCQALVKSAFMDEELNEKMRLTSANSINVARFLPQMFYYFHAYAQLVQRGQDVSNLVVAVPSGNFGNITAGLIGKAMGLPIKRFIAANNANDIFYKYLQTGKYEPKPSITTIANAMDVGDPSNFARVLDLYKHSHEAICKDISGCTYTDEQIAETMAETYKNEGYMLDPHGACGYRALKEGMKPGEVGVFIETAHPAKFKDTVEAIIGDEVKIPAKLKAFMKGKKQTVKMSNGFTAFKKYLMKV